MRTREPCHRCGSGIEKDFPPPGRFRVFGKVYRDTVRIRFNYLRMNTWEKAVTSADTVASNIWSEVSLCNDCWGDTLSFVNTRIERKP